MSEKVVTGVEGAYQISDKGCEVLLTGFCQCQAASLLGQLVLWKSCKMC